MTHTKAQKELINLFLPKIIGDGKNIKSIDIEFYDNNTKFSYTVEYKNNNDQESLFDESEEDDDSD